VDALLALAPLESLAPDALLLALAPLGSRAPEALLALAPLESLAPDALAFEPLTGEPAEAAAELPREFPASAPRPDSPSGLAPLDPRSDPDPQLAFTTAKASAVDTANVRKTISWFMGNGIGEDRMQKLILRAVSSVVVTRRPHALDPQERHGCGEGTRAADFKSSKYRFP
jgi:hypothetical protein